MFTNSFLEFSGGCFRVECAVLCKRHDQAAAKRIEYQAIGYRMNQPAGDRPDSRERFQAVSGYGKTKWQRLSGATLA
jgi:hypothetical protein